MAITENDKPKTQEEYQEWFKTLLTPDELSDGLKNLGRDINTRSIALMRKKGMPVGALVCNRPLYDINDCIQWMKEQAESNLKNSSKKEGN